MLRLWYIPPWPLPFTTKMDVVGSHNRRSVGVGSRCMWRARRWHGKLRLAISTRSTYLPWARAQQTILIDAVDVAVGRQTPPFLARPEGDQALRRYSHRVGELVRPVHLHPLVCRLQRVLVVIIDKQALRNMASSAIHRFGMWWQTASCVHIAPAGRVKQFTSPGPSVSVGTTQSYSARRRSWRMPWSPQPWRTART